MVRTVDPHNMGESHYPEQHGKDWWCAECLQVLDSEEDRCDTLLLADRVITLERQLEDTSCESVDHLDLAVSRMQTLVTYEQALIGAARALRTIAFGTPVHWDREFAEGVAKDELAQLERVKPGGRAW